MGRIITSNRQLFKYFENSDKVIARNKMKVIAITEANPRISAK